MQNVPLRVYSGDLSGAALEQAILLQFFWLAVMVFAGKILEQRAMKRIVVQEVNYVYQQTPESGGRMRRLPSL